MTDWMAKGACRRYGPDLFYSELEVDKDAARTICAACPVAADCLAHAYANNEWMGVWGGLDRGQRRRRAKRLGIDIRKPIVHGRENGYKQHVNRGETPCAPCALASAVAQRDRREQAS